jgi:hypothetical protein
VQADIIIVPQEADKDGFFEQQIQFIVTGRPAHFAICNLEFDGTVWMSQVNREKMTLKFDGTVTQVPSQL